ncbi:MAG: phosphoribosylglycinamide formyltransferase-1 [Enterobacterales bacterium]
MKTVSFLASHGGSAAKIVIGAIQSGELEANIGIVITNNRDSEIYKWCSFNNISICHISGNTHPDENEKDKTIYNLLLAANTDFIVLSGYMKKIGSITLGAYENKIMNIHPSLLPKHGGQGMFGDKVHESVLKSGDSESGATVQFINSEYDEGPIIIQQSVPVLNDDTVLRLKKRVQVIEGGLYISAIKKIT